MHSTRTHLAILAALLIAGSVRADGQERLKDAPMEGLGDLLQKLDRILPEAASTLPSDTASQLNNIRERLRNLESRLRRAEDVILRDGSTRSSFYPSETDRQLIQEVLTKLRALEERMSRLEGAIASTSGSPRIQRSFSPSDVTSTPTGSLRLENNWIVPATIVVNGRTFRLAAGEIRTLPVMPIGLYTFDVLVDNGPSRLQQVGTIVGGRTSYIFIDPPNVIR
jgi:hypothetical protein